MIDIRNIDGTVLFTAPVTKDAIFRHELMSEEYVQLQFDEVAVLDFPIGCYIEYNGKKYSAIDPVRPDLIAGGYRYTIQFAAEWMRWKSVTYFFINEFTPKTELSWSMTGTPDLFLKQIVDNIKRSTGKTYTFSYDSSLTATKDLQFDNTTVLEALSMIAEAFETEWWVEGTIIHLSRCEYGESITFTHGVNIGIPTPQGESVYATRIYAYGSTRNITQDYQSGGTANALVEKRLTLPVDKYPGGYKDIKENLLPEEIIEKTVVFDYIYPSSDFPISDVRVDPRIDPDTIIGTDANGNPIYAPFPIYYFKIAGIDFKKDLIIEGLTLKVHFLSGHLQGREFELAYHDDTKEYEIIVNQEGAIKIPNETLMPTDGDIVILFNIEMPQEYVSSAEIRLDKALDEYVENTILADNNTYTFSSNPVAFAKDDISVAVGRKAILNYGLGTLDSRVLSVEFPLDTPSKVEISVGESTPKGKIASVETEVVNAASQIEVIQAYNNVAKTIQNQYGRTQQIIADGLAKIGNMWYLDKSIDPSDSSKWFARSPYNVCSDRSISQLGPAIGSTGGGEGGTQYHDKLLNLDYPDQHPIKAITGLQAALDSKADADKAYSWDSIADKPTTIEGFGITDAVDKKTFDNHVADFNEHVSSPIHLTPAQRAVLGMMSVDGDNNLKITGNAYTSGWLSQVGPATDGGPVNPSNPFEEYLVPGEFWMGADGVMRQVYVRTFIGDFALSSSRILLISGVHEVNILHGYANLRNVYRMPAHAIFTDDAGQISASDTNWLVYVANDSVYIAYPKDSREFNPGSYSLTIKYTKA